MATIGTITYQCIINQVSKLLNEYQGGIQEAYLKHGIDDLDIAFKVTISPVENGNSVETSMKFRPDRDTKDKIQDVVSETQQSIFDKPDDERE